MVGRLIHRRISLKVLVTGAKGQLGYDTTELLIQAGHEVIPTDIEEMDITQFSQVSKVIGDIQPEFIVHCAAIARPDLCEENLELAYQVNVLGTRNVAVACEKLKAAMIYISTDYVFDGTKNKDYLEYDRPNPLNEYGVTKLAGEQLVQSLVKRFFVVRTAWLYGAKGQKNFVKTMLQLGQTKKEIRVVNDQFGTPTHTRDLAAQLTRLIGKECYGIYHGSNQGSCTWYGFAKKIFEYAGLSHINVIPITTEESQPKINRPRYSVMRNFSFELEKLDCMKSWEETLKDYFKIVGEQRS